MRKSAARGSKIKARLDWINRELSSRGLPTRSTLSAAEAALKADKKRSSISDYPERENDIAIAEQHFATILKPITSENDEENTESSGTGNNDI